MLGADQDWQIAEEVGKLKEASIPRGSDRDKEIKAKIDQITSGNMVRLVLETYQLKLQ